MNSIVERLDRALAARKIAVAFPDRPPLAVDLDGTLIKSDSLHEGLAQCLRTHPMQLVRIAQALRHGKAAFKREVTRHAALDPARLPYEKGLLDFLERERRSGRRMGLFTAADQAFAERVSEHLGCFDFVRGSNGVANLSGEAKLAQIRDMFGSRFAYAGDAKVDLPIFQAAESVVLVGRVDRLRARLPKDKPVEADFVRPQASPATWIKALRLQHWVKNILVFVAPILGIQSASAGVIGQAALLFFLFGLLASATYLINDLLDLPADRLHSSKRFRPLAAGAIAARDAFFVATAMIFATALTAALLPMAAQASLIAYLIITLAYSLSLKRVPMIDVMTLAALFTIRVVAGGALLPVAASPWLLTFSMLFFLGLAMIKRYAELERVLRTDSQAGRARGYTARDLPILLSAGVAAHMSAVVIFMIYLINEHYPRDFYHYPAVLWGMMPILLIWTLRAWHLSVHGQMNEDPVVFALKDRLSLALGVAAGAILVIAWI